MTDPVPPAPPPRGVRRSRTGAVLGGVCAGVARSAGLDPLLLRIAVVAVTLLTGGAGVLAYLAAWVLVPREDAGQALEPPQGAAAAAGGPVDVRAAWTAAGHDLRSLAAELRRPAPTADRGVSGPVGTDTTVTGLPDDPAPAATDADDTDAAATPSTASIPSPRSPVTAADDAATALGDRLRTPDVQAGARKAANSVSDALGASADELGRRLRRDPG